MRILVVLVAAAWILGAETPSSGSATRATIDIYVAPDGDDAYSGVKKVAMDGTGPLKSIDQAKHVVRNLVAGESPPSQIVVHVLYARLESSDAFSFDSTDSGKEQCRVVWRSDIGTMISGSRQPGDPKSVTDTALLNRVQPKYRSRLLALPLDAIIAAGIHQLKGGFDGAEPALVTLYRGANEMHFSRYPKNGFLKVKSVHGQTRFKVESETGSKEGIIAIDDPHCALWANDANIHMHGYWCWDWADQRQRIERFAADTGQITLAKPWHTLGYRSGRPCYAFNILAELSEDDEWYLDLESRTAYFLKTDGKQQMYASYHDQSVTLTGVEHFSIMGFQISGARKDGIIVRNCRDAEVANCKVADCGSWGIRVEGGASVQVEGCEVTRCGNGGIYVDGGERAVLTAAGHKIMDNIVHDIATWNWVYQPGIHCSGVGNVVSHNLIYDMPHEAISLSGNDHLLELNDISQACKRSRDAGVLYAWNDWTCRGNIIRWNYFHNCYGLDGGGCNGVYLDDHFSSAAITENIFYEMNRSILIGGGRDSRIANNIFIRCNPAIVLDARGLTWQKDGERELREKLLLMPYRNDTWSRKYPGLSDILAKQPMAPMGNSIVNNRYGTDEFLDIEPEAKPFVTIDGNAPAVSLRTKQKSMTIDELLNTPEIRAIFTACGSRPGPTAIKARKRT